MEFGCCVNLPVIPQRSMETNDLKQSATSLSSRRLLRRKDLARITWGNELNGVTKFEVGERKEEGPEEGT